MPKEYAGQQNGEELTRCHDGCKHQCPKLSNGMNDEELACDDPTKSNVLSNSYVLQAEASSILGKNIPDVAEMDKSSTELMASGFLFRKVMAGTS